MNIMIIGLGLIGGSLGYALRSCPSKQYKVWGMDRDSSTLETALENGAIDQVGSLADISIVDVVFLCTPVLQMESVLCNIVPYLKTGTIVTDVGSSKMFLVKTIRELLPEGIAYVGGHPMAGREKSGIYAAQRGLFKNKWYFLIKEAGLSQPAAAIIAKIIGDIGAKVAMVALEDHDRLVAVISHIPHIAAASLVHLLAGSEEIDWAQFVGGGFQDTTRIASSDADMWADICVSNADDIAHSLEKYCFLLETVLNAVREKDRKTLHEYFSQAKFCRDHIING